VIPGSEGPRTARRGAATPSSEDDLTHGTLPGSMSDESRTVLVTGATGCLGRAVIARFLRDGHRVVAASRGAPRARDALPEGARPVALDVTRPETLAPALEGVDVVVHAAAKVGDWGRRGDFRAVIDGGTRNLVEACIGRRLERFVHLSSVIFYGLHGSGVMTESMLPGDLSWPYAEAKVAAEEVVRRAHREHGLRAVILRPGNFFGPGSRLFTERPVELLRRGLLSLPPDAGKANLVFVENVAAAVRAVAFEEAAVGEVFNVVDDTELDWRGLFDLYAAALGARPVATRPTWILRSLAAGMEGVAYLTGRPPLITRNAIDYLRFRGTYAKGKLGNRLGFQAEVPFEQALARTADHLRQRAGR